MINLLLIDERLIQQAASAIIGTLYFEGCSNSWNNALAIYEIFIFTFFMDLLDELESQGLKKSQSFILCDFHFESKL